MSWGTTIKVKHKSIYLNKIDIKSMNDLYSQIEESKKIIDNCFKRLEQLAFATPKDIAPKRTKGDDYGYDSPYDFITCQINNIREEYDEEIWRLHNLEFAQYILEEYQYDSDDKKKIDLNKDWNKIVTNG